MGYKTGNCDQLRKLCCELSRGAGRVHPTGRPETTSSDCISQIEVHAERLDDDLTRVESNLLNLRIPKEELWEIVRDGLMGIGSLEQAIGEMQNYEAIGGFGAEELPVFESR